MATRGYWLLLVFAWLAGGQVRAQIIEWECPPNKVNLLTDSVTLMPGTFAFELGVFANNFVPTSGNTANWLANWVPARHVTYDAVAKVFTDSFTASNHTSPFTTGTPVYVWGFQGGTTSSEWILFRNNDTVHGTAWTWPAAPSGPPPFPLLWDAASATAIIGTINAAGTPFLMKSAAVGAVPSPITWEQWRDAELAGEPHNNPDDDPDQDGVTNLLEFVFGTSPKLTGAPPLTPVALVNGHLQITIPRQAGPQVTLTVLVSSNLTQWDSGPSFTEVVSNTSSALVVRDLTVYSPGTHRCMKLKAELPTP